MLIASCSRNNRYDHYFLFCGRYKNVGILRMKKKPIIRNLEHETSTILQINSLKTKYSKEFPCYLVAWWLFSLFVPKRRLSTSTFWHNFSLSRMKNENISYLELKRPHWTERKDGGGVAVIPNFFFSGKRTIFNDLFSRGIRRKGYVSRKNIKFTQIYLLFYRTN